jgi:hypothetical protein
VCGGEPLPVPPPGLTHRPGPVAAGEQFSEAVGEGAFVGGGHQPAGLPVEDLLRYPADCGCDHRDTAILRFADRHRERVGPHRRNYHAGSPHHGSDDAAVRDAGPHRDANWQGRKRRSSRVWRSEHHQRRGRWESSIGLNENIGALVPG